VGRERERAGQPGPGEGGRKNSVAEELLDALLFVLRKKKAISTGANGGELNLADAQGDAGAEDANLGKEREPPRAVLYALKGQPMDPNERLKTTERQRRQDGAVVMGT
jgi:hypothetical protein